MARGRKPKNKIEEAPTVKALIERVLSEPISEEEVPQNTDVNWDIKVGE
jgi:hypothetical protein